MEKPLKNHKKPMLSVVVVAYNMARQAMNTLYSLSTDYQRGVTREEYEVVVVENQSTNNLHPEEIAKLSGNFRYTLRQESEPTPIHALNQGIELSEGGNICLMIDGARMLSPRTLRYIIDALTIEPNALVAVPGYHIGEQDQKLNNVNQHNEILEQQLLDSIHWKRQGYRLFEISCLSPANPHSYLHPLMESNCLSCSKQTILNYGGANPLFKSPGGGAVNLDLYRGLCSNPKIKLYITPGEGTFHQYHGGVTTMQRDDLEALLMSFRAEYESIKGNPYTAVRKEPILIGAITSFALPTFKEAVMRAEKRFARFATQGQDPWEDGHAC